MDYFLTQHTFTRDVIAPGAVFCTPAYTVNACQVVAEFTRHFTLVVVHFLHRCTRCVLVHLSFNFFDMWTRDHCGGKAVTVTHVASKPFEATDKNSLVGCKENGSWLEMCPFRADRNCEVMMNNIDCTKKSTNHQRWTWWDLYLLILSCF